jgi:hypothetical protein
MRVLYRDLGQLNPMHDWFPDSCRDIFRVPAERLKAWMFANLVNVRRHDVDVPKEQQLRETWGLVQSGQRL